MVSRAELLNIAVTSYRDSNLGDKYNPGDNWNCIATSENKANGFYAEAYKNSVTNEVVIAYRGTEQTDGADWYNDMSIAISRVPEQYQDAILFYDEIKSANGGSNITVTGHSLGGALAQLVGAETGAQTSAFNAPGVLHLLPGIGIDNPGSAASYSNITNYSLGNDILNLLNIAGGLQLLGTMYTIPSTGEDAVSAHLDFDSLKNSEYMSYYLWYFQNQKLCSMLKKLEGATLHSNIIDNLNLLAKLIDEYDEYIAPNLNNVQDNFDQAQQTLPTTYIDPILIDLNGDGIISTTDIENGTYFDHGNDGFAETSAWVSPEDGILAIDKNNNGYIDNGSEIFGDNYIKSNNKKATNGFDALKDLDSNNDNIINSQDEAFSQIKILKGDGELISLEEAGIESINLNTTTKNTTDENGNTLINQGTYTKTDGTTGNLADFNLTVDKMNSFATEWLDETEDVSELPEILGSGTVHSLHQAILRDESGELKELVQNFITAQDAKTKKNIANQIIFKWTGADNINSNSRGDNIDARKLYALEQFIGRGYKGADNTNRPNANAAVFLNTAYQTLLNNICASLRSQTDLKEAFDNLEIEIDNETNTCRYNLTKVQEYIDNKLSEDEQTGKTLLQDFTKTFIDLGLKEQSNFTQYANHYNDMGEEFSFLLDIADKTVIYGTDEADNIEGSSLDEAIYADAGDDTIYSRQGNDLIYGGDGDDYIDACEGDDTIYGGDGDDTIIGGSGNDVIYGGDGNDTINGGNGNDIIYGGNGNDTISHSGANSYNYISGGDGDDIITQSGNCSSKIEGGAGNDTIDIQRTFYGWNNVFGGDGDDSINIKDIGNRDVIYNYLTPGAGNDTIVIKSTYFDKKYFNNEYHYNIGDGNDIYNTENGEDAIIFGEGITKENIRFRGDGNDLIVSFVGIDGLIRIKNGLNAQYAVETYKFNDATTLSHNEVIKSLRIDGTDGDDNIKGSNANETIYGYGGNDTIDGGNGADTIYGGDGNDIINNTYGSMKAYGEDGNDIITHSGDTGIYLNGGRGDDTINVQQATAGWNILIGEDGNDNINVKKIANIGTVYNYITAGKGDDNINIRTSYWTSTQFENNYNYNIGDGNDTIISEMGKDIINFGEGINKENLIFKKDNRDLIISFDNAEGSIRYRYAFTKGYELELCKFSDDSTMSMDEINVILNANNAANIDINSIVQDVVACNISNSAMTSCIYEHKSIDDEMMKIVNNAQYEQFV